jgi:hypothetical protein
LEFLSNSSTFASHSRGQEENRSALGWQSSDFNSLEDSDEIISWSQEADPGLSSWPSIDGPSIDALRSQGNNRAKQRAVNARIQTLFVSLEAPLPREFSIRCGQGIGKNRSSPPKRPPGRRGFKKQQARVTIATSNVQAAPSVLGKELLRLLVKKCTEVQATSRSMDLQGYSGDNEADLGSAPGPQVALSVLAHRLKAPFQDRPVYCEVVSV